MALYGGLAENTRRNERIERGQATVTGNLVITLPSPARDVTNVQATIEQSAAPGLDPQMVTVSQGTGSNSNQFTIYVWKATGAGNPTLIASTTATLVNWMAFCNLSGAPGGF